MASGIGIYHQQKKVDYTLAFFSSIFGICGAILGSLTWIDLPEDTPKGIIGAITISGAGLNLLKKKHISFEASCGFILFSLLLGLWVEYLVRKRFWQPMS